MTEEEKLIAASNHVDDLVNLLEDNPYRPYLYRFITPIKYEIERQLINLNVTDPNAGTKIPPETI